MLMAHESTRDFKALFAKIPDVPPFDSISHPVWTGGSGQPIILMHELDGFTHSFMLLAMHLSRHFTVYAPIFYGKPGQEFSAPAAIAKLCIMREFEIFRLGKTSRIANWIRLLADHIHGRHANAKGVGVVGMCMTGGIALATVAQESVVAAVAAQPSFPLSLSFPFLDSVDRRKNLGMDDEDVKSAAGSITPLLVVRYGMDPICPAERIMAISEQIPKAQLLDKEQFATIKSHATLTDSYREGTAADIKSASEAIVGEVVEFLLHNLE
jgi:dienelactone hydrolase